MNASFSLSQSVFRFFVHTTETPVDRAAKRAYERIAALSPQPDATLFTWGFLQNEGAEFVNAYVHGTLVRHRAAEALAQAWNTDLGNISAQQRRYRMASTAMSADLFFTELTQELNRS